MIIVIADVDEIAALLGVTVQQEPEIVRPQMSGPCVHYEDGTPYRCTYPYGDGCPHLDNPEILCPVKDACYAMREAARMQEACEVEQTEQDTDMTAEETVYETTAPEWVEPDNAVPHPTFRPGDRVRIVHPLHRGHTGEIVRYFPATENYLVAIDGLPDKIVLADEQMEGV